MHALLEENGGQHSPFVDTVGLLSEKLWRMFMMENKPIL